MNRKRDKPKKVKCSTCGNNRCSGCNTRLRAGAFAHIFAGEDVCSECATSKIALSEREVLEQVALKQVADIDNLYTYESDDSHLILFSMAEDGYVVYRRIGHAYYWRITDAGRDFFQSGFNAVRKRLSDRSNPRMHEDIRIVLAEVDRLSLIALRNRVEYLGQALQNLGIDCPACHEIAFTGAAMGEHTCKQTAARCEDCYTQGLQDGKAIASYGVAKQDYKPSH
jgi:hypothetical protein